MIAAEWVWFKTIPMKAVAKKSKQVIPNETEIIFSFVQLFGRKCITIDIINTMPVQNIERKFAQKFCIQFGAITSCLLKN